MRRYHLVAKQSTATSQFTAIIRVMSSSRPTRCGIMPSAWSSLFESSNVPKRSLMVQNFGRGRRIQQPQPQPLPDASSSACVWGDTDRCASPRLLDPVKRVCFVDENPRILDPSVKRVRFMDSARRNLDPLDAPSVRPTRLPHVPLVSLKPLPPLPAIGTTLQKRAADREEFTLTLYKQEASTEIGLRIAMCKVGDDGSSMPRVTKVCEGGLAGGSGHVVVGDVILSVDGHPMYTCESVQQIFCEKVGHVTLLLRRQHCDTHQC